MFLDKEKLQKLARCHTKKGVIAWLILNHIPHFIGDDGWPSVLWTTINALIGPPAHYAAKKKAGPNFAALKQRSSDGTKTHGQPQPA